MLEALSLASPNPQYDKRLFIDLPVQYKKTTSSEHVVYTNCFLFWHSEQFMYTTCSELVVFLYRTCNSMNNLLSYFELVDARISASEKDLPVIQLVNGKRAFNKNGIFWNRTMQCLPENLVIFTNFPTSNILNT